jgi:hypothetical protein
MQTGAVMHSIHDGGSATMQSNITNYTYSNHS